MIIAHLPAGYIVSRLTLGRFRRFGVSTKAFFSAGMFGSVAPDLDMFYFYGIDQRQHHHHSYITHFPSVWLGLLLLTLLWLSLAKDKSRAVLASIFALTGVFHILFDMMAGSIRWLAPFSDQSFSVFTVPALYQSWWLNFILHRSFGIELVLLALAVYLWRFKPLTQHQ